MSALEYYLTAFDEDFTKVMPRPHRRHFSIKQPTSTTFVDPLSALKVSKPSAPTHRLKDIRRKAAEGWSDKLLHSGFAVADKPIEKWTRVDMRRYVAHIYNLRWGDTLKADVGFALINEIIAKVEHCFRTQIGREGNHILKEYFDFFVDTQVPQAAKENGGMSWRKVSYQKYVLAFIDHWKMKQAAMAREAESQSPVIEAAPVPKTSVPFADAVGVAYRKGPVVLVRDFGVIVTINYLMMVRKQTLEKALAYVRIAVGKICTTSPADIKEVFDATEKYSPYPKQLAFTDADTILSELFKTERPKTTLGNNANFGFMMDIA